MAAGGLDTRNLHILADLLSWNILVVLESGISFLRLIKGFAEGGMLGPSLYPLVPDPLARRLESAGTGIAVVPAANPQLRDCNPLSEEKRLQDMDSQAPWRIPVFLLADDQAIPISLPLAAQEALNEVS